MPLLEPMRAFSGRMRNYYSGSRFAYIRLNGAEGAIYSHFSTLHAEFYELFAILAASSGICGLLPTAIGPAACRCPLSALQHPPLGASRRVGEAAALLPGRLPRPRVQWLDPHGEAGQKRIRHVHQPPGPERPSVVCLHGVCPFLLVTSEIKSPESSPLTQVRLSGIAIALMLFMRTQSWAEAARRETHDAEGPPCDRTRQDDPPAVHLGTVGAACRNEIAPRPPPMGLSVAWRPPAVYSLGDEGLRTPALMARGTGAGLLFRFPWCLYPAAGARLPAHGEPDAVPVLGGRRYSTLPRASRPPRPGRAARTKLASAAGLEPATYGRSVQLSFTWTESTAGLEPATYRRSFQLSSTQTLKVSTEIEAPGVPPGSALLSRRGFRSALLYLFGRYKHLNGRPSPTVEMVLGAGLEPARMRLAGTSPCLRYSESHGAERYNSGSSQRASAGVSSRGQTWLSNPSLCAGGQKPSDPYISRPGIAWEPFALCVFSRVLPVRRALPAGC